MKIAYLVNQYPKTSHSFIRREIVALEKLGMHVERFTIRRVNEEIIDQADQAEQAKTRVILDAGATGLLGATLKNLVRNPGGFFKSLKLALKISRGADRGTLIHLVYLAEACRLRDLLAEKEVEHLHAHFGTNSTAVAMLCHALGGPGYSFTVHGPNEFDRPMALHLDEKIRYARFAVAISSFGRSQLLRWCSFRDWPKVQVVHCGVDELFLQQSTQTSPIAAECRKFVTIGRLVEAKGQLLLIEAAAQLARDGLDFELTLVGDGPLRGEIERLIAQHHLTSRVRITGWLGNDAVRQEILGARALVMSSFAEGLPVVVMEALALRRPVICTRIAGVPELVEEGKNGWLVPAGSVDQLAEAMRAALSASPQQLTDMGNEGARRVAERHDVVREAAKLKQLIEQGNRPPSST